MESLTNFFEFLRIVIILVLGGTAFKACISIMQGKKVQLNPFNPLNLKARWPTQKEEKASDDFEEI